MGPPLEESALKAAYDAKYADFEAPSEYNASHILVETEEEAKAIRESLMAGADFAETAIRFGSHVCTHYENYITEGFAKDFDT